MGVPVTLDCDDVEALLFMSSAIKAVEQAVDTSKKDPFGSAPRLRFAAAHDRVANAWRAAQRGVLTPLRFEAATAAEIKELKKLFPGPVPPIGHPIDVRVKMYGQLRALQKNGFVELGSYREMVMWAASGDVTSQDRPEVQRYRLTSRGRDALEAEVGKK